MATAAQSSTLPVAVGGRDRSHHVQRRFLLAALPLLLVPFYYMVWRAPGVGLSHDDGIYLATAKALATGKGYKIISLPNEIRQTKYPVLFPVLLSFVWRVDPSFPENIPLLKFIPLLATGVWMLGVYRLARECSASEALAVLLTTCVAGNQWVVSFSGMLRPENLFAALATWAVVFLLRGERTGKLGPAIWAALLAAAAYHTRTAAAPILAAGVLGLLMARRYRLAFTFGALAAALCAPWLLWQSRQSVVPPVERYYTSLCYAQENILSYFSAHEKAVILRENLRQILISPFSLFGVPPGLVTFGVCLLWWGLCAVGAVRTKSRCLQLALGISVLLPVLWAWTPVRFLFPSLALMVVAAAAALRRPTLRMAALLLFFATDAITLQSLWHDSRKTELFSPEFREYPASWPQIMDTLTWVRDHASPQDVVISSTDPMVYLYTGLQAVRGFYIDALPVYYGLPAHVDSRREFRRVLQQYHPRFVIQMHPDFYEDVFLKRTTEDLIGSGVLREVHRVGSMHVYLATSK